MTDADVTPENCFDVIVIGGGPGGCSTATYLRQANRRVLVLEKEIFPRFHIGESLLPYNRIIFDEMGVTEALKAAAFPRKHGAQFHIGNGSMTTRFLFREGRFTRVPEAIQVERATFDHILLKHARSLGADVREGWTVSRFSSDKASVSVEARDPQGRVHRFKAAFLIDASGRGNVTGNQEGLREMDPHLKKIAVFGHFTGVKLDDDEHAGDTVITRLGNKWFWLIPVSAEKTSVGLVIDREEFQSSGLKPEGTFQHWLERTPPMQERMTNAKRIGEIQTASDFSYRNRQLVGERLVRVGDAAGFMDPIFSAGVYLAMWSGKHAAHAINASLTAGDDGAGRFAKYEQKLRRGMKFYWHMVEGFYTTPFMEIFMNPRNNLSLPSAVNAILAGELEGGWALRWRVWVFFGLIKVQSMFPIVPKISFAPLGSRKRKLKLGRTT